MGLLAMGSYWVVKQAPEPESPRPPRPVSQDPDYFMRSFSVRTYAADGSLKSEIRGSELRHYPATNTVEVDNAQVRAVDETGRVTTARARRLLTNDEQSLYTLSGDVWVIQEAHTLPSGQRAPRLEFRGQTITVLVEEDRLTSDQPVVMMRDRDQIEADRLDYDNRVRRADLTGRVRATLASRP